MLAEAVSDLGRLEGLIIFAPPVELLLEKVEVLLHRLQAVSEPKFV